MTEKLSHYFIEDETLESNIEHFSYYYKAERFELISDSGMFSQGRVDAATDLLLHRLPEMHGRLLDLGCGYGVIGIVLAKTCGLDVTLADVNGRALECARKNSEANGVRVELVKSDCFENIGGAFDYITLNPPIHAGKAVMTAMYKGARDHLNPGGRFFVVIQKKHGAESTQKALAAIFGNCRAIYKKKGYFVFECVRMEEDGEETKTVVLQRENQAETM